MLKNGKMGYAEMWLFSKIKLYFFFSLKIAIRCCFSIMSYIRSLMQEKKKCFNLCLKKKVEIYFVKAAKFEVEKLFQSS